MNAVPTRRRFIEIVPLGGLAVLAACGKAPDPAPVATPAPAAAPPAPKAEAVPAAPAAAPAAAMVNEPDAQATALGYVADASRVDKTRFPAYVAGSHCATCALYQGKAGEAAGPCPLYPGKSVAAAGWCGSWTKKA